MNNTPGPDGLKRITKEWGQTQKAGLAARWGQAEIKMIREPVKIPGGEEMAGCEVRAGAENIKIIGKRWLGNGRGGSGSALWLCGENFRVGPVEANLFFATSWCSRRLEWMDLQNLSGTCYWPGRSMEISEVREVAGAMREAATLVLDRVKKSGLVPEISAWGLMGALIKASNQAEKNYLEKEILALVGQSPAIRAGLIGHKDRKIRELAIRLVARTGRRLGQA